MVDTGKAVAYRSVLPPDYAGVAVDAGVALSDFLFTALPLRVIHMTVITSNRLSVRAATTGGGKVVASGVQRCADGVEIPVTHIDYHRDAWIRRAVPRRPEPELQPR